VAILRLTAQHLRDWASAIEQTPEEERSAYALKDMEGRRSVFGILCDLSGLGKWRENVEGTYYITRERSAKPRRYVYTIESMPDAQGNTEVFEEDFFLPVPVTNWLGFDIDVKLREYSQSMAEFVTTSPAARYFTTLIALSWDNYVSWETVAGWLREAADTVESIYATQDPKKNQRTKN